MVKCIESCYIVRYGDQRKGQKLSVMIGDKSFETVKHFKYMGTTLTSKNSIYEVTSRLKSGNACYH